MHWFLRGKRVRSMRKRVWGCGVWFGVCVSGGRSALTGQLSVHDAERFAGEVPMNDAESRMKRAEQRREIAGATPEMEEDAAGGDAPRVQPNQLLDLRELEVPVEVPGGWERRMVAIKAVPVLV